MSAIHGSDLFTDSDRQVPKKLPNNMGLTQFWEPCFDEIDLLSKTNTEHLILRSGVNFDTIFSFTSPVIGNRKPNLGPRFSEIRF